MKKFDEFILNENEGSGDLLSTLPSDVVTVQDAEQLLLALCKRGDLYHMDDDPHEIVRSNGGVVFTEEEADRIQVLMDKAFDVCDQHYNKNGNTGLWEGLVKGVFVGYIAFSATENPDSTVYIVAGSGGPGKVKTTTYLEYQRMESEEMDDHETDKWFGTLKPLN